MEENSREDGGCCGGTSGCSCGAAGDILPVMPKTAAEKTDHSAGEGCCGGTSSAATAGILPHPPSAASDEPCCGPPAGPRSSPWERPGYAVRHFVENFVDTAAGPVPRVTTGLGPEDRWGTISARLGLAREQYTVAPGLYCVGNPDADSPVLVTCNYKLTFDAIRGSLTGTDGWILVLDTRGVNVWCAAGKGTFSTGEVVHQVQASGLEKVVRHRKLVLPQLGATGVSAHQVKKSCGFSVVWGPIRAADLKRFLDNGMKAEPDMRRVTFTLPERLVLIPVELTLLKQSALWAVLAIFLLSGIEPDIFSFRSAWYRGLMAAFAALTGVLTGTAAAPALLPWLPGRAFAVKGVVTGIGGGILVLLLLIGHYGVLEALALLLVTVAVSSYLAMNFTGSTPFTSPSGVEKEMRQAIPFQVLGVLAAAVLWIWAAFAG